MQDFVSLEDVNCIFKRLHPAKKIDLNFLEQRPLINSANSRSHMQLKNGLDLIISQMISFRLGAIFPEDVMVLFLHEISCRKKFNLESTANLKLRLYK